MDSADLPVDYDLTDDETLVIAIKSDPATHLPEMMLGFPHEGEFIYTTMSGEGAFSLGEYLSQQAILVMHLRAEMEGKTLEQRKEIIELYAQYLQSPDEG